MKNDRRKLSGLCAIILCIVLAGCGSTAGFDASSSAEAVTESVQADSTVPEEENSEILIGVTLASDSADFQNELAKYISLQAAKKGVNVQIMYANWSASLQKQQMTEFISRRVDAIIIAPVDVKSQEQSLEEADEAGIPVINVDMKVDSVSLEYIATYVGGSSEEEGTLAAELTQQLFPDGATIGIIEGAPGSDPQIYRTSSYTSELHTFDGSYKVTGIGNGSWSGDKAGVIAYDLINRNQNIDLLYCHDNTMAKGAADMLETMELRKDVKIIGIGSADTTTLEYVRDGRIDGFILLSAEYQGRTAVNCAVAAISGEELRPWYKDTSKIVTKDNIDSIIEVNPSLN